MIQDGRCIKLGRSRSIGKGNRSNSQAGSQNGSASKDFGIDIHQSSIQVDRTLEDTSRSKTTFCHPNLRNTYSSEPNNENSVILFNSIHHSGSKSRFISPENQGSKVHFREVTNVEAASTSRVYISTVNKPEKLQSKMLPIIRNQEASSTKNTTAKTAAIVYPLMKVSERESELVRRLKIVEGRVTELQQEKQNVQIIMTDENRRLFHENESLKKKLASENVMETKQQLEEVQEMLEKQISKSLELMDVNQALREELLEKEEKIHTLNEGLLENEAHFFEAETNWASQKQELEDRCRQLTLNTQEQKALLDLEISTLKDKLSVLEREKNDAETVYEEKISLHQEQSQSKEAQFAQEVSGKNEEIEELQRRLQCHELKLEVLEKDLTRNKLMNTSGMSVGSMNPFENLNNSTDYRDQKKECSKCQDLLKTVFKLNAHLNKK